MYKAPKHGLSSFTCPHCEVLTGQNWSAEQTFLTRLGRGYQYQWAKCQSKDCDQPNLWLNPELWQDPALGLPLGDAVQQAAEAEEEDEQHDPWIMLWPVVKGGSPASSDMPDDVRETYDEAREVLSVSPRAAGALIRLALQQLMPHLGQPGKNLDSDIAALVKSGLPGMIQQSLDSVRVIGNESVHPGQIDTDNPETVIAMFGLLNVIVEDRITKPAQISAIYDTLPEPKKDHIAMRDRKADEDA